MNKFLVLCVMVLAVSGCNNKNLSAEEVCGTYQGTLPAASGPGIDTVVTLNKNNTFKTHLVYIDEKNGVFNEKGSFVIEKNIIELKPLKDEISYYKFEGHKLRRLDMDKKPITGALAKYYVLKKIRDCK